MNQTLQRGPEEIILDPNALRNTLLIGMTARDEYLLLETHPDGEPETTLLLLSEQPYATRYPNLRSYLARELATFQNTD